MKRTAIMLCLGLPLGGCATLKPMVRRDNSARLMSRPDFQAAKAAAPEWAKDALKTISALEYEIERRK